MASSSLPTQAQLLLPLLGALDAGVSRPREVADVLADEMGLTPEERQRRVPAGPRRGGTINQWDRTVRFAALRARLHGYLVRPDRGVWGLTDAGAHGLRNQKPGVVVTVLETAAGTALWAAAQDAVSLVSDGSIAVVFTSSPFPVLRKKP